ncbi:MAG: vanadium-dependent haloperoxidase [Saprospiraceae bacterium]|nr:vanadium-dependent haloperoxidase [Lewinella sp.]
MNNLDSRKQTSRELRERAARIAYDRNNPTRQHQPNGDEALPGRMMSFTKGLLHDDKTGLLARESDFEVFKKSIESGDPKDFIAVPLGPGTHPVSWKSAKGNAINADVRAWESAGAGLTFDLQGPDAQSVTMPPAPSLGSQELTAEMAEIYCQALLRDIPLSVFFHSGSNDKVEACLSALNQLDYFKNGGRSSDGQQLNTDNVFRGFTPGDQKGPYVSQFLLTGNSGLNTRDADAEFPASAGMINYGALTIDQRVRQAAKVNYMTEWDEFIDVQNGADFRRLEKYEGEKRRFITTGRDLATYVHYDALYEAYLNACLLLLSAPLETDDGTVSRFDKGVPFQKRDLFDKQEGFAHYGGPHILTLVTEAATRALKAVRYQKFNVHRRLRPEAFAARMEKCDPILKSVKWGDSGKLRQSYDDLENAGIFNLLRAENGKNLLLPMAFCEGSPMHPSYGAGHATVAGACVTILKAFFNHELYVNISEDGSTFSLGTYPSGFAFIPDDQGQTLEVVQTEDLKVQDELNKLAANISIGRNWAGVHYYSDYKDSLLLGEEIAIGILQEQSITYNKKEKFFLTLPKFNGEEITISGEAYAELLTGI